MVKQTDDSHQIPSTQAQRLSAFFALLVLAPIPTIGVWFAAFGQNAALGSFVWAFAKIWLFIGPAAWWFGVQKNPFKAPRFSTSGLLVGLFGGAVLCAIIVSAYWLFAQSRIDFSNLTSILISKGIDSKERYLLLVLYLTLVNSLIEEYVFRWFMFEQLKKVVPAYVAVLLSGVIFMVHHTVVLSAYVPWVFNLLASIGVLSGGLIWSFLYHRYGQIWPSYLCHIGADIGVFIIGYHALFS